MAGAPKRIATRSRSLRLRVTNKNLRLRSWVLASGAMIRLRKRQPGPIVVQIIIIKIMKTLLSLGQRSTVINSLTKVMVVRLPGPVVSLLLLMQPLGHPRL